MDYGFSEQSAGYQAVLRGSPHQGNSEERRARMQRTLASFRKCFRRIQAQIEKDNHRLAHKVEETIRAERARSLCRPTVLAPKPSSVPGARLRSTPYRTA